MMRPDPGSTAHDAVLVLIRHGRTDWNASGRFLGRTDRPLDAAGHRQAAQLAPWRDAFEAVYASPLRRARGTAEGLVPPSSVRCVDALAELDHGVLEGLRPDEAMAHHPSFFEAWARDPGAVTVPGGACLADARDAALDALRRIAADHPRGRVAVVSHQLVLASVLATLHGRPLTAWREHRLPNVGCAVVRGDGDRLSVVAEGVEAGSPLDAIV